MGFIKNALIGIALYEAAKYCLTKKFTGFDLLTEGGGDVPAERRQFRNEEVDIIAGARQTDQLQRMQENALRDRDAGNAAAAKADPEPPISGEVSEKPVDDPWKNSLANDELRAPDS